MEIKSISALVSELGFPVLIALVSVVILYKLSQSALTFAGKLFNSQQADRIKAIDDIREQVKDELIDFRKYLEEEINSIQDQHKSLSTIVIRLNDRITNLNKSLVALDTSSRIFFGQPKRNEFEKTLHERRQDLQDELNQLNPKNGD
tara:strand:+ start:104 stop:544 length:441 start_codon:yes stop_codon:yes gene_type:complete